MRYSLRVCGANDFVSKIDPDASNCSPPGDVEYVAGWNNPKALYFASAEAALDAAKQVRSIDGIPVMVESLEG